MSGNKLKKKLFTKLKAKIYKSVFIKLVAFGETRMNLMLCTASTRCTALAYNALNFTALHTTAVHCSAAVESSLLVSKCGQDR